MAADCVMKALTKIVDRAFFPAGEQIYGEGDESKLAYFVQTGAVLLSVKTDKGVVPHATVRERQVFGEMALLEETHRPMAATAIVDTTCILIQEEEFKQKLKSADPLVKAMLRVLARNLSQVEYESSWDAFKKREGIDDWIDSLSGG